MITKDNATTRISQIIASSFHENLKTIPIKTGNLRYNATQLNMRGSSKYRVLIDEQIAPYGKYVNERGKSAGFWDKFFINMARDIELKLRTESLSTDIELKKAPLGGKQ